VTREPGTHGRVEMVQSTSIGEWLTTVGIPEYATRFAENDIDVSVLGHLTDRDLEEMGVSLGHRRKLLATIAERSRLAPVRWPHAITPSAVICPSCSATSSGRPRCRPD
jgi:hypothetical protein